MKALFFIAFLFSVPVMANDLDFKNQGLMTTPTCETFPEWTTKNISEIDLSVLGERPHRVLKPDSMATMDYLPDRLNIHTTEGGVILSQDCG